MDILYRFLTQTLRGNQTELQLSEMRRNQVYMMLAKTKVLTPKHRRRLALA
ncbi:hypothetical protein [Microvirga sp. Mcv34]|uniref:hypothetical protein n=1 Tax=Microvirga sp. Mcv34 TaxID=2926016 RepID=UPI0021C6322B|nr:hypothetical protein [Microvirga sp. Mcv34]